MTTDELNAIVKAVMDELEKAGVDFDFKAETPQADDLVYVMRGTADKYQGITVKWQNLLGIIVQKATEARDEAVSAKDIALQTLATIQGIESNVSSMKSSVDASEANVASMKASVETSEANVTQMKSEVSEMKASVEGTKTEVEGLKSDVTALKSQTQTIVDNAKEEVTGLLDTKVSYSDALTYEEIMASTDLTNKVAGASALKSLRNNLNELSVLKSNYGIYNSWNIDDLDSYPKGRGILHFASFSRNATGAKPFTDGHILTFIWRNDSSEGEDKILNQIAVEDNLYIIKMRYYTNSAWSAWKIISIS